MNITRMKNRPETKQSLVERYGCGPVKLSGNSNAFYERHVTFDQVVAETETTARDKFEAIARSVRDMLSQRWLKTEADLPTVQRQARLLPLDGISARSRSGQQYLQSSA